MRLTAFVIALALVACASDVGDLGAVYDSAAPTEASVVPVEDVGVAEGALTQYTWGNSNCDWRIGLHNKHYLAACGFAQKYQTGFYACTDYIDHSTCWLAYGSGPDRVDFGACVTRPSSNLFHVSMPNPPSGTLDADIVCGGGSTAESRTAFVGTIRIANRPVWFVAYTRGTTSDVRESNRIEQHLLYVY